MAITINGSGSITGISAGGLPDGSVTAADLASSLDLSGKTITNMNPSGVYLGGTGSANYLDDYETGTWTPVYSGSTSAPSGVTYDAQEGNYKKVGGVVTVTLSLGTSALTVGSGNLRVTGLPFTVSKTAYARVPAWNFVGSNSTYNSERPDILQAPSGGTYINFWDAATVSIKADATYLKIGASGNRIYVTFSYLTDA